jgi:hypothetical protein
LRIPATAQIGLLLLLPRPPPPSSAQIGGGITEALELALREVHDNLLLLPQPPPTPSPAATSYLTQI